MTKCSVKNLTELLDAIAAGDTAGESGGLVAVKIKLWDGREVIGSHEADFEPSVTSELDFIDDDAKLRPFVETLVTEGKSFVTQTSGGDLVCTLLWEIKK